MLFLEVAAFWIIAIEVKHLCHGANFCSSLSVLQRRDLRWDCQSHQPAARTNYLLYKS